MTEDDLARYLAMRDRVAELQNKLSRLRTAGFYLMIEDVRITLCDDPDLIAMDRDGEGGCFSLREFANLLHRFISERL